MRSATKIPGRFIHFIKSASEFLGQQEYEAFLQFLIEEKIVDENLNPSKRFFKIGLGTSVKDYVVVEYFKWIASDTLPRRHPRKRYALYISEFGFEALVHLYNLKKKSS